MADIFAVDPGPGMSAWVLYRPGHGVLAHGKEKNDDLLSRLRDNVGAVVVLEMIASYGMAVGAEVFETCVWIGAFGLAAGYSPPNVKRLFRKDVKLHLCGQPRAKDANIRAALIDRFGGKAQAIGTKKKPGPLYGVTSDRWAALAVAITYAETQTN